MLARLVVVLASCAAVAVAAAPASAAKPLLSGLVAYPASVPSGGASGISATVTEAGECTLSAPKGKPVSGLPERFPCGEDSAMRVVPMPANKGKRPRRYTLTLSAEGPSGKDKSSAKVAVTVLPEAAAVANKQLVAVGYGTTCAVLAAGAEGGPVRCWGSNGDGDLGAGGTTYGYSPTPVAAVGVTHAVELAAGVGHTCALLASGHIKCWGASIGLGNGSYAGEMGESTPVAVANIADAVQITAGYSDTCALLITGHVDCWGANTVGQLGRSTVDEVDYYAPVEIPMLTDAVEVAAGREHTCARLQGGAVDCWGGDSRGQLGDGTAGLERSTPVAITEVSGAGEISSGEAHSCAVVHEAGRPAGQVKCWGWDRYGQLGSDSVGEARKPEDAQEGRLLPISGAVQVSAGIEDSCALLHAGTVECWGGDTRGQLGDGEVKEQHVAVPVGGGLEHVVEIAASTLHACAVLEDAEIRCWGSDSSAELGDGKLQPFSALPVAVEALAH